MKSVSKGAAWVIFCLSCGPVAAASGNADRDDRTERLRSRLDAFLVGATINDAAVHDAFWAETLVYTSSRGVRFGKAALMAGVRDSGPVSVGEVTVAYSAQEVRIDRLGEAALLDFVLVATDLEGDEQRYLNSGVFVWRDARWQAVRWQATQQASDD